MNMGGLLKLMVVVGAGLQIIKSAPIIREALRASEKTNTSTR